MSANPNEQPSVTLVTHDYGSHGWGLHIERQHEDPWAPKILYKVERAGICFPAVCQDSIFGSCLPICKSAKKRSYLYITESSVEQNIGSFDCFNPLTCKCCEVSDFVFKDHFDNSIYAPFCPCKFKRGIATEQDLNYCCFCINCVCVYDVCTKPCCGGVVATVLVENDSPMYPFATRCCAACCVSRAIGFIEDSNEVKANLMEALRKNEARVTAMTGVKTYQTYQTAQDAGPSTAPVYDAVIKGVEVKEMGIPVSEQTMNRE